MKSGIYSKLVVLTIIFLISSNLFPQDVTSNVISNAKLTLELNGKRSQCITNEKGEFAILISDTSKYSSLLHFNIINVEFPKEFQKHSTKSNFFIKVKNAPYFEFVLFYKQGKLPEEVELIIKEKPGTKFMGNEKPRREKGDASKVGEKYMGQVAHF